MRKEFAPEYERVVLEVAASGADVVLIGGLAMIALGSSHYTVDSDFAFSRRRETIHAIVRALAPFHPKPVDWDPALPFIWDVRTLLGMANLTLHTDIGRIDFLAEPAGAPPYEVLRDRAEVFDLEGVEVRVASIEDLMSMKRAAGRPKDLAHLAELETIKRLREVEGLGP